MSIKQIIPLYNQRDVYEVEDAEGTFLYRFSQTHRRTIQIRKLERKVSIFRVNTGDTKMPTYISGATVSNPKSYLAWFISVTSARYDQRE